MKRYVAGYYAVDTDDLEVLSKDSNREIVKALRAAYPGGLDASEIHKKTGLSLPAVHAQLKELRENRFVEEKNDENSERIEFALHCRKHT